MFGISPGRDSLQGRVETEIYIYIFFVLIPSVDKQALVPAKNCVLEVELAIRRYVRCQQGPDPDVEVLVSPETKDQVASNRNV